MASRLLKNQENQQVPGLGSNIADVGTRAVWVKRIVSFSEEFKPCSGANSKLSSKETWNYLPQEAHLNGSSWKFIFILRISKDIFHSRLLRQNSIWYILNVTTAWIHFKFLFIRQQMILNCTKNSNAYCYGMIHLRINISQFLFWL